MSIYDIFWDNSKKGTQSHIVTYIYIYQIHKKQQL